MPTASTVGLIVLSAFFHMPRTLPSPAPVAPSPSDPNFVHSLAKGLEILSAFSEGDMLGNQQLVTITGFPKATVSRLTSTLVQLGYLRVDSKTRKLILSSRLLGMGATVQRKIGLQSTARPLMSRLSAETGLTVMMGARDRLGMVILEVVRPPTENLLVTNIDAGVALPIAGTSSGLAYIVAAPVKERTQIFQGLRKRFPDDWHLLRERIERAHLEYTRYGFVTSLRSWEREVSGLSVPFAPSPHSSVYTFNIAGPLSQMPVTRMRKELGPKLLQFSTELRLVMQAAPGPKLSQPEIYEP